MAFVRESLVRHPWARFLAMVTVVALLGFSARPSVAQPTTDQEQARDHFKKGLAAYNLGQYAEAATEFQAAYRLYLDPALLFNIAQAYRMNGETEKALNGYRAFLRTAPPGTRDRSQAERWRQELERKLALTRGAGAAAGATSAIPPAAVSAPGPAAASAAPVNADIPNAAATATAAAPTAASPAPATSTGAPSLPERAPAPMLALASPNPTAPSTPAALTTLEASATAPTAEPQASSGRWWIWTAVAVAAVAGGVATAVILSRDHAGPNCLGITPCGTLH